MRNGNLPHNPDDFLTMMGSYPTYEEWKHSTSSLSVSTFLVLILPMRNGNQLQRRFYSKQLTIVLILPMRNGNSEQEL